jgi:NAD(P)-dependent dehydrogenase (short-subunit alcohol dehydrogenase family)
MGTAVIVGAGPGLGRAIAEIYWELHQRRQDAERLYTAGSGS